ncbi:MAG TPA: shikimate kinase [Cyanobacteria bacterium UBA8156]|jgi:shikimate kinase|nr:shikimate kinase [Cyanobacteria bacterium UBA8156]
MLDGTNVFLIGLMGAGKTTVGRLLAPRLGYTFVDTDALVEKATGKSVAALFAEVGEAEFRHLESQVLAETAAFMRLVAATGGGVVLSPLNWSHLRHGIVIWLDAPVELLCRRLAHDTHRPLLQGADRQITLSRLLAERQNLYAQADLRLTISTVDTPESLCERAIAALQTRLEPGRLRQLPP